MSCDKRSSTVKKYEAIFFDWDGTAVVRRDAPIDEVMPLMHKLLAEGIVLFVISGTTYEKIAAGKFHEFVDDSVRGNLYMGLARGAYNYEFTSEGVQILQQAVPDMPTLAKIHDVAFELHARLLRDYGYETDIVFSRPNYCKIDLLVNLDRAGQFYFQPGELELVNENLAAHQYKGGIQALVAEAVTIGRQHGLTLQATTDAKYLEVGPTTKADNVDFFLDRVVLPRGIDVRSCCFWGDEFTFLGPGVPGSDALMMTDKSRDGDFYDVSENPPQLPDRVTHVGGGVKSFLSFLRAQGELDRF